MDFSGVWNQLLVNTVNVCLRPAPPSVEQIQVITAFATSNDTTSSLSSETSTPIQEDENERNDESGEGTKVFDDVGDDKQDNRIQTKDKKEKRVVQRIRYSKEEYRCVQCPYTCTTEKAFLHHLRWCTDGESEPNKQLLSCPICGKDRKTEETLGMHMTKHKQDRYFCCDICKFKTLQLKKLIQHRRMHTGEKPHLCPFCSYRSSRRDNLRSHVRRVHKKQDLPCDTFIPRSMVLSPRKKD